MGKKMRKNKEQEELIDPLTYPIHKSKSFQQNMDMYLKMLKMKYSNIQTRQYLKYVHNYVARCRIKFNGSSQRNIVNILQKIKICKGCNKWNNRKMVKCYLCDDNYHLLCADNPIEQDWVCKHCYEYFDNKQVVDKNEYAAKYINKQQPCSKCAKTKINQKRISGNNNLVTCISCSQKYHKKCFGNQLIVCHECNQLIQKKIDKQGNLLDYGFCRKTASISKVKISKWMDESTQASTVSNQRLLKNSFPQMTEDQIAQYKKQLLYAIYSKNMEYTQQLVPINCTLDNDTENSLDFSLIGLNNKDEKFYQIYKKQPIGPFHLEYKQNMGYNVVAGKNLPSNMIVCQYVGEVVTWRQALKSYNDSVMELKVGCNADETLCVRPEKYSNIARFLNGINNINAKSKQNIKTHRSTYKGKPIVLLITSRAIVKGETLLYDYNGGQKNTYPTEHFV